MVIFDVKIGEIKKSKQGIVIEKINYFGEESNSDDWNAKVIYSKNGKYAHAEIYIDYYNRGVFVPKKQSKYAKAYLGLESALKKELF